jgi:hypothetical protein
VERAKACKDATLHPRKLKTPMKTKFAFEVIFFKETLELKDAINLFFQGKHLLCKIEILAYKHGLWQRKSMKCLFWWSHNARLSKLM